MTFYWGFGDFFRIMGHTVQCTVQLYYCMCSTQYLQKLILMFFAQ